MVPHNKDCSVLLALLIAERLSYDLSSMRIGYSHKIETKTALCMAAKRRRIQHVPPNLTF